LTRCVLTDAQWAIMEPYCLGKSTDPGQTGADPRLFMEAVLWIVRTGVQWRALPGEFGNARLADLNDFSHPCGLLVIIVHSLLLSESLFGTAVKSKCAKDSVRYLPGGTGSDPQGWPRGQCSTAFLPERKAFCGLTGRDERRRT